jgi:putative addiction module component (TIGR02574 family)
MTSGDEVLAAALRLSTEERSRLVHELLVSLDEGEKSDDEAERQWAAEIERRARAVLDGTADRIDWQAARERIRVALARAR